MNKELRDKFAQEIESLTLDQITERLSAMDKEVRESQNADAVTMLQDEPVLDGEEDLMNSLNSDSEVNINQDGDGVRLQAIIEAAADGSKSYDDIVAEWNEDWAQGQESAGVEVTEE